jgi:hypothetical protein
MGIFDFLGDLSSKRSKELGLGGLQSLLGTRGAAQVGAIGDEMMQITGKDSLPGYFNEQTREYVPWYVDLFDGGGLNKAGTVAEQEAAQSMTANATPGGAPMAQPGLLANNQLSDMERANRSRVGVDPRNLGGAEGYGPMSARDPRNLGGAEGYGPMSARDPRNLGGAEGYGPMGQSMPAPQQGVLPQMQDNVPMSTPRPRESTLNTLRENAYSVGPIDAYRNALNNRPDIPLTQPFAGRDDTPRLSDMQSPMMQHPEFSQFVDIMKRAGNESVLQNPEQALFVFNNYLKQIGYN